jgi:hypothetical protein
MKNTQNILVQNLSGGQKRKLTFGIAILGDPQVSQTAFIDNSIWNQRISSSRKGTVMEIIQRRGPYSGENHTTEGTIQRRGPFSGGNHTAEGPIQRSSKLSAFLASVFRAPEVSEVISFDSSSRFSYWMSPPLAWIPFQGTGCGIS